MVDKNFVIPKTYQKMDELGFTDPTKDTYLWLNEMEWTPISKIMEYEYDQDETHSFVPFGITGRGDKWVWVIDEKINEHRVGLCKRVEPEGEYYAENMEDAILMQIIDYVADACFYINEEEALSYQISEEELKIQLDGWKNNFKGILKDEYINLIDDLSKLSLKPVESEYGKWCALLTIDEQEKLIHDYVNFDLMYKKFQWRSH